VTDTPRQGGAATSALAEERRVVHVVESSVLFGAADRAVARVWQAAGSSKAAALARRVVWAWRALDTPLRRLGVGVALLSGTATHLALTLTAPPPPGWMWLVLPGLFIALGLLLVAASGAWPAPKSPR
jgi:hypothetical protein